MTTVGDPLIDLAWAMIFWPEEGNPIALAAPGTPNGIDGRTMPNANNWWTGTPRRPARDLSAFDWYQAFSAWKLAIVLEGSYAKHVRGESRNPLHEIFGSPLVDQLLSAPEVRRMTDPLFDRRRPRGADHRRQPRPGPP